MCDERNSILVIDSDNERRAAICQLATSVFQNVFEYCGTELKLNGSTHSSNVSLTIGCVLFHSSDNHVFMNLVQSTREGAAAIFDRDSFKFTVWYSGAGVSSDRAMSPEGFRIESPIVVNSRTNRNDVTLRESEWRGLLSWLSNRQHSVANLPQLIRTVANQYVNSLYLLLKIYLVAHQAQLMSAENNVGLEALSRVGVPNAKNGAGPCVSEHLQRWIDNPENWYSLFGGSLASGLKQELSHKGLDILSIITFANQVDCKATEQIDMFQAAEAYIRLAEVVTK